LKTKGDWISNGPVLPLEFSRISGSRDGALTLVIDPENGTECLTSYILSDREYLEDAICDLRVREGTVVRRIGFVNLVDGSERSNIMPEASDVIRKWASTMEFDAVIWTDLPSDFEKKQGKPFTIENAINYLTKELNEVGTSRAYEYISKAPKESDTELRKEIVKHPWYLEK
jgi:hypothetical protein